MPFHPVVVITTIVVVCLLTTQSTSAQQWTSTSNRTVQIQSVANPSQYLGVPFVFPSSGSLALGASGEVFIIAPLQPGQSNEVAIIQESTGLYLHARRYFSGPPLPPGIFFPPSALNGVPVDHFQLSSELTTGQSLDDPYSGVWSETRARSADGSSVVDIFSQEIFYIPDVGAPRHTRAHLGYEGKMEPISSGVPPPQWHSVCQPASCGGVLHPDWCTCCDSPCQNGGQLNEDCSCTCSNTCDFGGCIPRSDCSCCDLIAQAQTDKSKCEHHNYGRNPVGWPPGDWGYSSNGRYEGGGCGANDMRMLSSATSSFRSCVFSLGPYQHDYRADYFYFYVRGIERDVSCTVNINWNGDSRFYSTTVPALFDGVAQTRADGIMPHAEGPWMAWTIDCDAAVLPSWRLCGTDSGMSGPRGLYVGPIWQWKAYECEHDSTQYFPWVAITTSGPV